MTSGWDEWEAQESPAPAHSASPATEAPARGEPPARPRRARREQRRLAKQAAVQEAMAERRRLLDRMEGLPGLPLAILAVVAFLVLVLMHERSTDGRDAASASASPPPAASSLSVPPIEPVLDPHAGSEVLPPRTMPTAIGSGEVDTSSPTLAAKAFAAHACQFDPSEPAAGFAERVADLATSEVAAGWQRAGGTLVRCMQLNAGLDSSTPNPDTSPALVHVTAVQVYRQADGSMTAYRWAAQVTVTRNDAGQWQVSGT